MAAVQEPEVQFAQRLASNEKPIRTRAMKKLRKYIGVRSQRDTGGFTGDELLKLWKGLFYCLWMQDKPLLQEELSNQISSLLNNFQTADGQFLYLESFLQTFKREWTGIDRLRMDKFFQLVRFMFRQTFEMLKRKNWDISLVGRFLELLTAQLLHSSSEAPSGLQFHVLDLYMTELAAVGSQELTADQNLIFIEPFCKTAAKTKDGILFRAICSSIFSTIIDQAPFAIDDLMNELKAAEASDSDSGQASEEEDDDEEEQLKKKTVSKPAGKKKQRTGKQMNGKKSNDDEDEDDDDEDDDDDDDELLHLEDSDTEAPGDDDIGPVLQFDYTALADKLFELASRSNTPSQNRQRLYKIIKVLRDLSEGIFPQDEYPEEVSTDEDDDSFGSRKRMKKRGRRTEEDEEGAPASKKKKKKVAALDKQDEDTAKDDSEPADLTANTENKKKKRKKKKKKKKNEQGGGEGGENAEQEQMLIKETEVSQTQSSISSVKVIKAATPEGQPEALLVSEVKKQPSVTVTEETSQLPPCTTINEEQQTPEVSSDAAVAGKKKKKKKKAGQGGGEGGENTETSEQEEISQTQSSILSVKVTQAATPEGQTETLLISEVKKQPSVTVTEETSQPETSQTPPEVSSDAADAAVAGKKKKKRAGQVGGEGGENTETSEQQQISQTQSSASPVEVTEAALPVTDETSQPTPEEQCEKLEPAEEQPTTAEVSSNADATASGKKKKKKKGLNAGKNLEEAEAEPQVNGASTDADVPSKRFETFELETQTDSATPAKKKSKKKNLKTDEAAKVEVEAEIPSAGEAAATAATPLKKKTKKKDKQEDTTLEAPPAADESSVTPLKKKKRKNSQKESVEEDSAAAVAVAADAEEPSITMTTSAKKKKKKPAAAEMDEIKDQDDGEVVSSSGKAAKKKKRKIPIVFEYEADELEAAASINGLAEEEGEAAVKKTKLDAGEPSTPLSTKKSKKKATSDFITFQSNAVVPTPLFCKTKGGLSTPLSSKKKNQTPKSESKKVTFGLKNNKTAEFRKTDRSLLVSPDGSSRVPFDPKQKPKFGVLKSPATPRSTGAKKTPNGPKKTGSGTPKSTPKRRPSAADFF